MSTFFKLVDQCFYSSILYIFYRLDIKYIDRNRMNIHVILAPLINI